MDRALWVWLKRIWKGWEGPLEIVKPQTVVGWHREGFKLYWRWISRTKKPGRPRASLEIRRLIKRLAKENPTWRAPRIHSELLLLGFDVSERTISRYIPKRKPDPGSIERWITFLRNHQEAIAGMDLFTIPSLTYRILYGLVIVHHGRRKVIHFNATLHPTSDWVIQQLREAFPYESAPGYLIFDRDDIFNQRVVDFVKSMGTEPVRTAYRSPWQSGITERWIGNCRREILDHIVPLNERHLVRVTSEYIRNNNEDRPHLTLAKDSPYRRLPDKKPERGGAVVALPRVGGLHHRYTWLKAA